MVTLAEAIRDARSALERAGVPSPLNDARLIAAHLLGCGPLDVTLRGHEAPPEGFADLVARRASREPLQHLLGTAPFGPLDLKVGEGVFIPRPETEVLAEWAVHSLPGVKPMVVDLCTGSGALAAYIATSRSDARVTAVELSPEAAQWARQNLDSLPTVTVIEGDATDASLLESCHGQVDLVVSNPPYVPETDDLDPEVYQDPSMAVFSGVDGMDVITRMVPVIHQLLKPGGLVGIEHDDTTSDAVQEVFRAHGGFQRIAAMSDLVGRDRFVTASKLA